MRCWSDVVARHAFCGAAEVNHHTTPSETIARDLLLWCASGDGDNGLGDDLLGNEDRRSEIRLDPTRWRLNLAGSDRIQRPTGQTTTARSEEVIAVMEVDAGGGRCNMEGERGRWGGRGSAGSGRRPT